MKNNLLLILIVILSFIACETKITYPTAGKIELTAGKIDTLAINIKAIVTDSMKSGIEAIATYQQDSIYNLEWTNSTQYPLGTIKKVRFDYSGINISSRIVKRKAEAYLKADLTVLGYKNLVFVDAMDKDSLKNSLRTVD